MFKNLYLLTFISFFISLMAHAGEPSGSHNSAEWQIWAYSSAAPSFVGDKARITGSNGEILREGSN